MATGKPLPGVDRWHECLRKRPFESKCAALTTAPGRTAYLCRHCGKWHLATKKKGR